MAKERNTNVGFHLQKVSAQLTKKKRKKKFSQDFLRLLLTMFWLFFFGSRVLFWIAKYVCLFHLIMFV